MKKKPLARIENSIEKSFEILLDSALKSLKTDDYRTLSQEAVSLLSKQELLALIKSFNPEDATELLLVFQHLIGFLWTTEKLCKGRGFEPFANLSFRATDLLIRYKSIKLKKAAKNDIPHEPPIET
jgi:hypothetical protein